MALLPQTAFVGAVTYASESAVLYFEQGRSSVFVVVTGIPNNTALDFAAASWIGYLDKCGSTTIRRSDAGALPRILQVDVQLVTTNKLLAYWVEEQAATWQARIYGTRFAAEPPPLP